MWMTEFGVEEADWLAKFWVLFWEQKLQAMAFSSNITVDLTDVLLEE